ncbi:MAG: hypothetical protein WD469_10540 [Paenibacillaceae bacterium]
MKKIILGMIIGIGLSLGVTTYADDIVSMIGKKVEGSFPLIINNARADKDVLVIDGTSYLPVRSAALLFGYDVSFNADLMVVLTKKNETVIKNPTDGTAIQPLTTLTPTHIPAPTAIPVPTASKAPVENKADIIKKIKNNIIGMNAQIGVVQDEIIKQELLLKSIQNDTNQAAKVQSTKVEITRLKSVLADSTKQLDQLKKLLKEQK